MGCFHVYFTPTSASWLNQVVRWFATQTERYIHRGTHRSTSQLGDAIEHGVKVDNDDPKLLAWCESADDILGSVQLLCLQTSNSRHQRSRRVQSRTFPLAGPGDMHRLRGKRGHRTGPAHYFTFERNTPIRRRDHGWCEVGLGQTRSRTAVLSGAQFKSEAAARFRRLDCRGQILGQGSCCTHRSRRGTSAGNDGRGSFNESSGVQVSNSSAECLLRWRPQHSVPSGGAMRPISSSSGAPTAGLQAGSGGTRYSNRTRRDDWA